MQKYFQVYFSNRFRDREFMGVQADNDVQAVDKVKSHYEKTLQGTITNAHAQEISKEAYDKLAKGTYNPAAHAVAHIR